MFRVRKRLAGRVRTSERPERSGEEGEISSGAGKGAQRRANARADPSREQQRDVRTDGRRWEQGKGRKTRGLGEEGEVEARGKREDDASASVARVIITDFPDLILRTVTRHNSLTQIAHERM